MGTFFMITFECNNYRTLFVLSDDLTAGIAKAKALLLEKANPNSRRSQQEITEELDLIVNKAVSKYILF